MAIPPYVVELRRHIGHALIWLPGVTAVVLRDRAGVDCPELLLVQRADTREWTPVTGIVDPGENPHTCAEREVLEETGVTAVVQRLAWVSASAVVHHPNGDLAQYLDHTFICRYAGGSAHVADDESCDVRWWPLDALPPMAERY